VRVAILASGGKDSSYAAWWATLQGWEVVALVTMGVRGSDSLMFQLQNTSIAGLQAASMGVPWLPVITKGEEVSEIYDLEEAVSGHHSVDDSFRVMWPDSFEQPENLELHHEKMVLDGLVVGALRSDYQKTNIEMMCERLEIRSFCPLWHKGPSEHMKSLLDHGFDVVFTSVSCEGMDESWLGSTLDESSLERLEALADSYRFNLDGEGGEFETIVTNGPHLDKAIIFQGEGQWERSRGALKLKYCSLEGNR